MNMMGLIHTTGIPDKSSSSRKTMALMFLFAAVAENKLDINPLPAELFFLTYINLKLELLTEFASSNDDKYFRIMNKDTPVKLNKLLTCATDIHIFYQFQ